MRVQSEQSVLQESMQKSSDDSLSQAAQLQETIDQLNKEKSVSQPFSVQCTMCQLYRQQMVGTPTNNSCIFSVLCH